MLAAADRLNALLNRDEPAPGNAQAGPLAGLSLAVKDIFDIAGQRTGGGNPQKLDDASPAVITAPAILALLQAGARFAGRAQTDELTFSLMGQNAHFPEPINPAAPDRVTGGSSSGSAAAVAGGLVDIAAGSDTGGSIRAPASFCGLVGLRTTHGAISLAGAMPLAPSLDTFGWFARDIATYETVGRLLLPDPRIALRQPLRLAALEGLLSEEARREYRRIEDQVADVLGEPREAAALTHSADELYQAFRVIQGREAWAAHGAWLSVRDRKLGPGVKERFAFASTVTAEMAAEAEARREVLRGELAERLGEDGVLILPTVPGPAPLKAAAAESLLAYRDRAMKLLCLAGLSGFPQITVPLGQVENAPFGISLLGPAGSDMALIRLAGEILAATGKA